MPSTSPQKNIAVVGAGVTGLAAAWELAKSGRFEVTVFERSPSVGGLSSSYRWANIICDRFYHVILPADVHTLELVEELELGKEINWKSSLSAFYKDGRLVPLATVGDFIRFPFLSFWDKFRLGIGILYSARIKNSSGLHKIYARQWLIKIFGKNVYTNIWGPLLRSKLGAASDETSAAFIWANISRLYGARQSRSKQEMMGYISGGYHTVLMAFKKKLAGLGVRILTNNAVTEMDIKTRDRQVVLHSESQHLAFDSVLYTISPPDILDLLGAKADSEYVRHLQSIAYLGIVCVLLVLNRKLSPYYVINLLDPDLPFTGIIETTNVLAPADFGNKHLVYLPRYVTRDDLLSRLPDDQIKAKFLDGLRAVFPDLSSEDIHHAALFRERHVQPILNLDYVSRVPNCRTPIERVYMANSAMIYDSTINNNAAVSLGKNAASIIKRDIADAE